MNVYYDLTYQRLVDESCNPISQKLTLYFQEETVMNLTLFTGLTNGEPKKMPIQGQVTLAIDTDWNLMTPPIIYSKIEQPLSENITIPIQANTVKFKELITGRASLQGICQIKFENPSCMITLPILLKNIITMHDQPPVDTLEHYPTEAPNDGILYGRKNKNWISIDVLEGATGPQGAQGLRGEPGERGSVGPQGIPGANGLRGEQGERGERGVDGARGADGSPGVQGPAGEKGVDGSQGPQGPQGEGLDLAAEILPIVYSQMWGDSTTLKHFVSGSLSQVIPTENGFTSIQTIANTFAVGTSSGRLFPQGTKTGNEKKIYGDWRSTCVSGGDIVIFGSLTVPFSYCHLRLKKMNDEYVAEDLMFSGINHWIVNQKVMRSNQTPSFLFPGVYFLRIYRDGLSASTKTFAEVLFFVEDGII